MAKTYLWSDLINYAQKFAGNLPTTTIDAMTCDIISSTIWNAYPWPNDSLFQVASLSIPLVDGQQDYNTPTNISEYENITLLRTDVTPNESYELDVANWLPVNLISQSYNSIQAACLQPGAGVTRLDSAVQVPAGILLEISGTYKLNPVKVSLVSQNCWFDDKYAQTAIEFIIYYYWKITSDIRAGAAGYNKDGQVVYSGQLGVAMASLRGMKDAEDFSGIDTIFPEMNLSPGKETGGNLIFPNN